MTLRAELMASLRGEPVEKPVFGVYDWFVEHRDLDWKRFFGLGLAQVNHATVTKLLRPHLEIVEEKSPVGCCEVRRDVYWKTDIGELHEWYLGEWRQEHLVKKPEDYLILARAFSDADVLPALDAFTRSEAAVGDGGMTLAVPAVNRTPFQAIQIDYAGLEQFSVDIAMEAPELLELIEVMNEVSCREFEQIRRLPVEHVKLWENLTLETMGPALYRKYLAPLYRRILGILGREQKLVVHYDGKLKPIARDIGDLPFDGVDSLTPPPEGDMTVEEARQAWPDKYLWLHPRLGWYTEDERALRGHIRSMVAAAGGKRFCLMISEDIPHEPARTIPLVLEELGHVPDRGNAPRQQK